MTIDNQPPPACKAVQHLLGAARFFTVAAANVAIGLMLIFGLLFVGLSPVTANILGYTIAIPFSYYAHSRISFQRRTVEWKNVFRYVFAVLLSYAANLIVLIALTKLSSLNGYLAQIPALATYAVVFYLVNHFFVFAQDK